jgi:hypothetical protein
VSFLGGLLENNTLIARELLNKIKEKDSFNVVEPKGTALDGAIEYCFELVAKSEDI